MKTASRLLIASLASVGFVGTAAANTADEPTTDGAAASEPAPDGAAPDPNAPAVPDPNAPAPAAASSKWPRAVIARPLTLPAGVFQVGADITNNVNNFFDPANIKLLGGYGLTDDIEVSFVSYAFTTSSGKGDLAANLGYKLARGAMGGKLEAIGRVQLGYNIGAEALDPLALGVHVQYNVTDKIAVITPGQQLQIGLESPNAIALGIPVAVGFQATPELYVQLDTLIANIAIKEGATSVIFRDATPIALTGVYNVMPALDVLVGIALDLTPPDIVIPTTPPTTASVGVGDTLTILVGARYYGGKLN